MKDLNDVKHITGIQRFGWLRRRVKRIFLEVYGEKIEEVIPDSQEREDL